MQDLLIPLLLFALLGGLFGLLLALAARAFAVKEDPRLASVREALPGGNCGGCGYSGCDAYAAAVVRGEDTIETVDIPIGDKFANSDFLFVQIVDTNGRRAWSAPYYLKSEVKGAGKDD